MALILTRPWTQQPKYSAPASAEAGITRDLVGLYTPFSPALIPGTKTIVPGLAGVAEKFTTGNGKKVSDTRKIAGLPRSTVFAVYDRKGLTGTGEGRCLYCERSDNTQIFKLRMGSNSSSNVTFTVRNSASVLINGVTLVSVNFTNAINTAAFVTLGDAERFVWADGVASDTNTTTCANTFTTANDVRVGGDAQDGTVFFNGGIYLVATWSWALSVNELNALALNPWQLFGPQRLVIPSFSAAPTMPVLSAPTYVPGSLTSSGWIPQITAT